MSELREQLREGIARDVSASIQEAWDDWCSDTGCFPDDFKITRGPKLWFSAGSWASQVGKLAAENVLSLTAVVEVVEALEACAESLSFARGRLGMTGEGDGKDHRADAPDDIGSASALEAARAALSRVGVLRTEVQEQGVSSSCAELAAIATAPPAPSQDEGGAS